LQDPPNPHKYDQDAKESKNNLNYDRFQCFLKKNAKESMHGETSLPIIAIAGTGNSHGASPKMAVSGGLLHSKTNAAATISCILKHRTK